MTLDNLLPLVDGKLLNNPSISSFSAVTDQASRVQRGDLFVCIDQDLNSISKALDNGAYGIVFDKTRPQMDNETAWIKVDSCFDAHLKLLRFHLMPKQVEVYYSDIYTLQYISMLKNSAECKVISEDISDITSKLWQLDDAQKLLLKDQPDLRTLFPMAKKLTLGDMKLISISALESDLEFDALHYNRLKVPQVLQAAFNTALTFLQEHHIPFSLQGLSFPANFDLIFCDTFYELKEFGKGKLILLFTQDLELAQAFLGSVAELNPWMRTKIFLKQNLNNLSYNNFIFFEDDIALRDLLQNPDFDLAVICHSSSEILSSIAKPQQLSLF